MSNQIQNPNVKMFSKTISYLSFSQLINKSNMPSLNMSKPCSLHQLTLNREPWNVEPELYIF